MYHLVNTNETFHRLPPMQQQIIRMYGTLPLDRFGFMDNPIGLVLHPDSIHKPQRCIDPYHLICRNRAKQLLERGERLYVYWSGGIDSTIVLVALIEMGATFDDITVVMSRKSLFENKGFYDRHIDGKFPTTEFKYLPEMILTTTGHMVTGELNDHIHGTEGAQRCWWASGWDAIAAPNTELNFCFAVEGVGWPHDLAKEFYRNIMGSASKAKVKLRTVFDCLWWVCFAFKWQTVTMRMYIQGPYEFYQHMREEHYPRASHFFGTPEFQNWACTGHEKRLGANWSEYKLTAKRYVHRFDRDDEWYQHAVKIASLKDDVQSSQRIYGESVPRRFPQ